jgi:hypothetical protein
MVREQRLEEKIVKYTEKYNANLQLIKYIFPDMGYALRVSDATSGCMYFEISDPRLSEADFKKAFDETKDASMININNSLDELYCKYKKLN